MNLCSLAGEVKSTYPGKVEVEVIYPSQMDNAMDLPKAPNIAVDGELLGPGITYKELEEAVMEKLLSQKQII